MKVLQVETIYSNSGITGLVLSLMQSLEERGDGCKFAFGRKRIPVSDSHKSKVFLMEGMGEVCCHFAMARIFDSAALHSSRATRRLIKFIEEYQPDIIHLHSLLGYYINVKILFEYLEKSKIPVVWTHHDCWAFTGHCIHFSPVDCMKWQSECHHCPLKGEYPQSMLFDNSKRNYRLKKRLFTSLENMTCVAPSKWLGGYISRSFLGKYPLKVIPNGIDREIFKPRESGVREKYQIGNKTLLLSVASNWAQTKGLAHLFDLYPMLDGERYAMAIIGLSREQIKNAPKGIVALERTNDQTELAEWYSAADLFLNPTMADNFPTVNLEALACATPVITFSTGGSAEMIGKCGMALEEKNAKGLFEAICRLEGNMPTRKECRAHSELYGKDTMCREYIKLYEEILKNKDNE